jgi:hypothetical protein
MVAKKGIPLLPLLNANSQAPSSQTDANISTQVGNLEVAPAQID